MSKVLETRQSTRYDRMEWSFRKLKQAFENLLTQELLPLKLCIFIDGLDEYDGDFMQLATFCKTLSSLPNCKLCVSSRPLVDFSDAFKASASLMLHHLTYDDIKLYTEGELKTHQRMIQLHEIEPDHAPELITEIVEAASGVFLWVKLAVYSLLQGLRNHDRISDLQRRLKELPRDFDEFYKTML
jgi:hypothetical protein